MLYSPTIHRSRLPEAPTASARGVMPAHFGSAAEAGKIAGLGTAERLYKMGFGKMVKDARFLNMSIYDWAQRLNSLIIVYLPQAYFSFRDNKHKWETNGRNALIWLVTLGLTVLTKHSKVGVNPLLDRLMLQQGTPEELARLKLAHLQEEYQDATKKLDSLQTGRARQKLATHIGKLERNIQQLEEKLPSQSGKSGSLLHRMLNRFRLPYDYLEAIQTAGILERVKTKDRVGAYWAKLDGNEVKLLQQKLDEFSSAVHNKQGEIIPEKLSQLAQERGLTEQAIQRYLETVPKFLRRMNVFRLLSTGIITALTVSIIGSWCMKVVFKYIAPLDHDFDPEKTRSKMRSKKSKTQRSVTHAPPQGLDVPEGFQPFCLTSQGGRFS